MTEWNIEKLSKTSEKNPILIEGLPGIGNVGKIAVEYLIDALKAKKVYEIRSNELHHYVFVNEKNLIELPCIDIYSAKISDKNILLLSGDIQPHSESACHSFCNKILETFEKSKGKEIITLGGIAMHEVPTDPTMYFTANSSNMLKKYSAGAKPKKELHEFIGPIVGVTGLLPGLAGRKKIPAITILVETSETPGHIGLIEAKKLVKHLNKKLGLKIKEKDIEKELSIININSSNKTKKKSKKKEKGKAVEKPSEDEDNLHRYIG
jgi:proteasome assembly chaperone (PAC2) family protein